MRVSGDDEDLRIWLEEQHLPYALGVHEDQPVALQTERGVQMKAASDCVKTRGCPAELATTREQQRGRKVRASLTGQISRYCIVGPMINSRCPAHSPKCHRSYSCSLLVFSMDQLGHSFRT